MRMSFARKIGSKTWRYTKETRSLMNEVIESIYWMFAPD